MKIATKLIAGYITIALLAVAVGYFGITLTRSIDDEYKKVADEILPVTEILEELRYAGLRIRSSTNEYGITLLTNYEKGLESKIKSEIMSGIQLFEDAMGRYETYRAAFPHEMANYEAIRSTGHVLQKTGNEIVEKIKQNASYAELSELKEEYEKNEAVFISAAEEAIEHEKGELSERKKLVKASIMQSINYIALICIISFILALVIGVIASHAIAGPIKRLNEAIQRTGKGEGDFEVEISSRDEIGELAANYNSMTKDLREYQEQLHNEITGHTLTEKELRRKSNEWEATFNSINDLISIHDNNYRIFRVNKAFSDAFRKKSFEIIGKKCYEVIHGTDEPVHDCPNKHAMETGTPCTGEFFEPSLGAYLQVTTSPIFDEKGENLGTVHIAKDITEQKQAQDNLMKAHTDLEKKVRERTADLVEVNRELEREVSVRKNAESEMEKLVGHKDMFITRLGHDLKTPLTPLLGLLPLIKKQAKSSEIKSLVDACMVNVLSIKDLVVNTLKLARARSFVGESAAEDLPLMSKVNGYVQNIDYIIDEKRIAIENNIGPEIVVRAEELDLEELFYNLIVNSVKYTPEDGVIIIDAKNGGGMVTVSVQDTGIGLNDEDRERIFEEFYRVDASRHELSSSGLGLSICKKIVENYGGEIWAESPGEEHGTTFHFTIKAGSPGKENKL